MGWVSLAPLFNSGLFTSYITSYKGFKSRFVKIKVAKARCFCIDPRPRPLYLRESPKFKGLVRSMLKKQGVDMAELIRKARLTNEARSTVRKASDADTTTVEPRGSLP
ncbi:hypothetical protein CR513_23685, partial [Mucuna pruriens]